MKRAKQIARNVVDQLGPADLAAVVFTFLGRAQNFTADRAQLMAAIDSFTPGTIPGVGPGTACIVGTRADLEETRGLGSPPVRLPPISVFRDGQARDRRVGVVREADPVNTVR